MTDRAAEFKLKPGSLVRSKASLAASEFLSRVPSRPGAPSPSKESLNNCPVMIVVGLFNGAATGMPYARCLVVRDDDVDVFTYATQALEEVRT